MALASLIVFPDLDAIATAFPALASDKVGHDVAYPAMLSLLPSGLQGQQLNAIARRFHFPR